MPQKQQRPLLDERGLLLTSIRGTSQMRGTCLICRQPDKPLHRYTQEQYWCATCVRKKQKEERVGYNSPGFR